ncbi:MAG: integrase arm-type DNA-binding domain-containing protein [Burkholderiaceae bacterium]|nr:integrase arm-type DNA-binding domain-containing protein [Burkholderiaceae bacterium]
MARKATELTALQVKNLTKPGMHFVGAVPGLALQVLPTGGRTWILRATMGGKRRDMGLGGYPEVTLAQAREDARNARDKVRQGIDPVEQGREARNQLKASQAAALTFKQCAESYIKTHRAAWKSAKHGQQWENSLAQHVFPVFGGLLVHDVSLPHVMKVLEPIWTTTNETAVRVRGRIELILDWAGARGYRSKENPARWRGHLDKLLPKPSKVNQAGHHAALPVSEAAAFMVKLRASEGMGARALEFAILTAARSGEVRGATWAEFNFEEMTWTVPAGRIKAGKEHRVPLTNAAVDLLNALPRMAGTELVFPAPRGGMLSDMTLSAVMRRLKVPATVHGFRSTFRDWVGERTSYPGDMAEMALAHAIGDKTEAAYRRGDMVERRRMMMDDWAAFLARPELPAKVIDLQLSKRA